MIELKKNEQQLADSIMGKVSLSKDKEILGDHVVNLSKCVVSLSKANNVDLGAVSAKVVVVLDYSGSMSHMYSSGRVQEVINRLVPLGLTFDNNGSLDVYLFSNSYKKLEDLNIGNYSTYIQDKVNNRRPMYMGGTLYAPVLNAILFGEEKSTGLFFKRKTRVDPIVGYGDPTFVIFITDGENQDDRQTDDIVIKSSNYNIFIQFVGIGNENFNYLKKLDSLDGRAVDNTGFVTISDIIGVSDTKLYNKVLREFSIWLRETGK